MKRTITIAFIMALAMCIKAQDWWHVGPHSNNQTGTNYFITGRAQCIAVNGFHPDSMYAGSRGGVWITADGGNDWAEMNPNNQMFYGGATSIIVGPTSHHIYFASSDIDEKISYSSIYVYDNANSTWYTLAGVLPACYINNIQFYPGNENIIYACTNIGLYKSTNGGATWANNGPNSTGVYNVVFFQDGATIYGFASGSGVFLESINGGSFTDIVAIENTMSSAGSWTQVASNICLGDLTTSTKYMYLLTYVSNSGSSEDDIYQVTENSGTVSIAWIGNFDQGGGDGPGRLALGYVQSNGLLFCGGVQLVFDDTRHPNNLVYLNPWPLTYHTDQHYVIDNPSLNTVFAASDGGIWAYNYSGYSYPNSPILSIQNNGLDISQVNGFSGAGPDTTLYVSGEQDIEGFVYDFSSTSTPVRRHYSNLEDNGGVIDQFLGDTIIVNSTYDPTYTYSTDAGVTQFRPDRNVHDIFPGPTFVGDCTSNLVDAAYFGRNVICQDPTRPGVYYLGTNEIDQWEPTTRFCDVLGFAVKYATYFYFGHNTLVIGPTCTDTLQQNYQESSAETSSIAICPYNKNGFYYTVTNYVAPGIPTRSASQVMKFVGSNIDDVWNGHNDAGAFAAITPDISSVESLSLTCDQIFQINYPNVVVSPWDPNFAWVSCNIPASPGIRVLAYDAYKPSGSQWSDYSTGLPSNEIPYSMMMETGSNNGIYLGTDRAVYYRNATMSSWMLYSTNLPAVRSNQLEINYYENKIRSGTYGRGIWESSLYCPGTTSLALSNYTNNQFDEVTQYITSQASITPSGTLPNGAPSAVYYRAGEYVSLTPGFYATTASNFMAYIHPCNSSGNSILHRAVKTPGQPEEESENIEPKEDYHFKVYPNPNAGAFTVSLPTDETSDVYVYNLLGTLIYHETQLKGLNQVNLQGQSAGMYFVKAITSSGKVFNSKVVIAK